jgi:hypothetical protein
MHSPERSGTSSPEREPSEWTCPSCGGAARTAFCPSCGERRPSARDLHLRDIVEQALESFVSFDGRLVRSVRMLVAHPGALTTAYVAGRRKPFVGPVQLFLAANIVFFAAQSLTGLSLFFVSLESHLEHQRYSALARAWVNEKLARSGLSLDAYAPIFDRAAITHSKSLVIVLVPPFALAAAWLFRRAWRSSIPHLVFALHFFAFQMIAFSVLFVLAALLLAALRLSHAPMEWQVFDNLFTVIEIATLVVYLYLSVRSVYGGALLPRLMRVCTLAAIASVILYGYRLFVFVTVLITT